MPNIAKGEFTAYQDDMGNLYNNYQFKIRSDKLNVVPYEAASDLICPAGGGLFKHRKIVAQYPDKSTIEFPIASAGLGNALAIAQAAKDDGAICLHLEGEAWSFIPPSLLNNVVPNRQEYIIPEGPALKEVGVYDYASDLLGAVVPRYSFEINPLAVSQAVKSCLANPVEGRFPCTVSNQIKPRHLTIQARNANGGFIVRKTNPQNVGPDVAACAEALLAAGFCVSYKGESARNIQNLGLLTP